MFVLFLFSFGYFEVYGKIEGVKPVLGGKNNFEVVKPTYQENAKVTSSKICSKDGNNPFLVYYDFDLSNYKDSINADKFEMIFKTDSDSWYQKHVKKTLFSKGKKEAWERPILSVYVTKYGSATQWLIDLEHSDKSNDGKTYNLDIKIPRDTKIITFLFNSEGGGAYGTKGFGAYYKNMSLIFRDKLNDKMLLKGKLTGRLKSASGIGYGILLDKNINVQGNSEKEIYITGINIENFLKRSFFTYKDYSSVLKDEYKGNIDIQVYVDKNTFKYWEAVGAAVAEVKEIVSLNGSKKLQLMVDRDYPIEFYIDTFRWYLDNVYTSGYYTKDIKNSEFYKKGGDFKTAVDKILQSGLHIQMEEGYYFINETEENYSEDDIETSNVFNLKNLKNLKNGDVISGDMIIDNIEYTKYSNNVKFDLIGETLVNGYIYYDKDYYKGYVLIVTDPYLFNSQINIDISKERTFYYIPEVLVIKNERFISEDDRTALKQGRKLQGKIGIKDISFNLKKARENCELTDFLDVTITD
jgi:hypothetical protein